MKVLFFLVMLTVVCAPAPGFPQASEKEKKEDPLAIKLDDAPTFIKADSLSLNTNSRVFTYSGNVEVTRGELKLTAAKLEGQYDANNQIDTLTALTNVVIVKGDAIRAVCQKAIYEKKSETLVLTDNPELQQDGSILTADAITLFLTDDRSTAEGNVRVKLIKQDESAGKEKAGKS